LHRGDAKKAKDTTKSISFAASRSKLQRSTPQSGTLWQPSPADLPPDTLAIRPAPPFPKTPERLPPVHWLATSYRRQPPPICTCCGGSGWRALTHDPRAELRAWACTICRPDDSPGLSEGGVNA
jgi:hypothetical protein